MVSEDETKRRFAEALKTLMKQESFTSISVSDIAKTSGLSRKSFYNHFSDKYELINWICYTEFVKIRKADLAVGGWHAFKAFLEFFVSDAEFFYDALKDMSQNSFGQYFSDLLYTVINESVGEGMRRQIDNEKWIGLSCAELAECAQSAILVWLSESDSPDPDALLDFIQAATNAFTSMMCFQRSLTDDTQLCDWVVETIADSWDPSLDTEESERFMPDEISQKRQTFERILAKTRQGA